jgi:probable HAF family extracellular repeat protein
MEPSSAMLCVMPITPVTRGAERAIRLLALVLVATLASAQMPTYTVSQIAASGTAPSPRPINNSGQVVYTNGNSAFLWTSGAAVNLGFAAAGAINDRGQVAGTQGSVATQNPVAVLWTPNSPNGTSGTFTTFLNVIAGGTNAIGINNYGQVIGQSGFGCPICSYLDSYLWTPFSPNGTDGSITADENALIPFAASPFLAINDFGQAIANANSAALYTPSSANGTTGSVTYIRGLSQTTIPQDQVAAINSGGVIVGTTCESSGILCNYATNSHGFVWTPTSPNGTSGTAVEIPIFPGYSTLQPAAINAGGQVVGTMGGTRPFFYQNGSTYDLGTVRSDLATATPVGISDKGQIVLNANGGVYLLTPPPPPTPTALSPASGAGQTQTMTFTFSDSNGWQNLGVVNILINNFIDGRSACYLGYSVPTATLFLVNDAGQAGGPFAGSSNFETANTIQNSQCSVRPVSVNGSGNLLTLMLAFTFQPAFNGNKIVFLAASENTQNSSGWLPFGVWQVPGGTQTTTTAVVGMTPASGNGAASTPYTFQFSDTKGVSDLGVMDILINSALDGRNACYLAYARPVNVLYLVNDAGTALLPGMSLSAAGSLSNSQCSVSWGSNAVAASGNILSLRLSIGFTQAFGPNLVFYLAARDINEANNTGWQASGVASTNH